MSTDDEIVNHEAYAAILHIEQGDWDRHLLDIHLAVRARKSADEFRAEAMKRAEIWAGDYRARKAADPK